MKEYSVQDDGAGSRTVSEGGDGPVVAVFPNTIEGMAAFDIFKEGCAALKGVTLFDANSAQYLVGDLGQLVEGR